MRTTFRLTVWLWAAAFCAPMLAAAADGVADAGAAAPPNWVMELATKYPTVSSVLLMIGILRLAVKPAFSIWHAYVEATETKADDEFLAKVESSKWLQWLLYGLDWLASVKLVKK